MSGIIPKIFSAGLEGGGAGQLAIMNKSVTAAFAMLIWVTCLLVAPVAASATEPEEGLQLLETALEVGDVPADYVLVLDTSSSMKDVFATVQESYVRFIGALDIGDHLSIIFFDTFPDLKFTGPIDTEKDRSQAIDIVRGASPDGALTDIGAAIELALDEIGRPLPSPVQNLIFLTDGEHDPPDRSRTSYSKKTGEEWDDLRASAQSVRTFHRVYGLGVKDNTDIDLLKGVFVGASILSLQPNQLGGYFDRLKTIVRVNKIGSKLVPELESGTIEVVSDSTDLNWGDIGEKELVREYRLRSGYSNLPVSVDLSGVELGHEESGDYQIELVNVPEDLVLDPGQVSEPFMVRISRTGLPALSIGETTNTESHTITFLLEGKVLPDDTIEDVILLNPTASTKGVTTDIEFDITDGLSWWTIGYWTLAILGAIALLLAIRWFRKPRLRGFLELTPNEPYDGDYKSTYNLAQFGRKATVGTKDVVIPNAKENGTLYAKRERDEDRRMRTVIYLRYDGITQEVDDMGSEFEGWRVSIGSS